MPEGRVVRRSEGEVYDPHWTFKMGSRTGGTFDFLVGTIPYLSGPPLHTHEKQEDSFFILESILTVQVGDDVFELEPGDFASVPPGVPHTFDNTHKDQAPVKACNLMTPSGLDQIFFDMSQAGDDFDKLVNALTRNGVTIVGPTLGQKLGLS